ncbi:MAG: hypothetical protein NTW56_07530 [Alphaproteobacteria bacterium]|nr:hypothetical protein [Alphaproteobacteria bacterium]
MGPDKWETTQTYGENAKIVNDTFQDVFDNNEIFASRTTWFDTQGWKVTENANLDNGNTYVLTFGPGSNVMQSYVFHDANHDETWSRVEYSELNSGSGQWMKTNVYDDYGRLDQFRHDDLPDNFDFEWYVNTTDADGQFDGQYGVRDNGTTWKFGWNGQTYTHWKEADPLDYYAHWKTIDYRAYDMASAKWASSLIEYNDSTKLLWAQDTKGIQRWSQFEMSFNADGTVNDIQTTMRDGLKVQDRTVADGNGGYQHFTVYRDASGVEVGRVITAATGLQTANLTAASAVAGAHLFINASTGSFEIGINSGGGWALPDLSGGPGIWEAVKGVTNFLLGRGGLAGSTLGMVLTPWNTYPPAQLFELSPDFRFIAPPPMEVTPTLQYRDANGQWQTINGAAVGATFTGSVLRLDSARFTELTGLDASVLATTPDRGIGDNSGNFTIDEQPALGQGESPDGEPPNGSDVAAIVGGLFAVVAERGLESDRMAVELRSLAGAVVRVWGADASPENLARALDLARDSAISSNDPSALGRTRPNEFEAAIRYERANNVLLDRSGGSGVDFIIRGSTGGSGPNGQITIDEMGSNLTNQFVPSQMNNLVETVVSKLRNPNTDLVLVDVSRWSASQVTTFESRLLNDSRLHNQMGRIIIQGRP